MNEYTKLDFYDDMISQLYDMKRACENYSEDTLKEFMDYMLELSGVLQDDSFLPLKEVRMHVLHLSRLHLQCGKLRMGNNVSVNPLLQIVIDHTEEAVQAINAEIGRLEQIMEEAG